jgi:hypothetical protein
LVAFFLTVLAPVLLKLGHYTRVAAWPWAKVLAPLWGPWLLLAALSLCGWFVRLASRWYDPA